MKPSHVGRTCINVVKCSLRRNPLGKYLQKVDKNLFKSIPTQRQSGKYVQDFKTEYAPSGYIRGLAGFRYLRNNNVYHIPKFNYMDCSATNI